ncbi:MAG: DUF1566 domain-containing protein [Treponema sp.]|jgi:hypothetical protein|nr:DUF1566 domain-containing protein [Treponema sp.]
MAALLTGGKTAATAAAPRALTAQAPMSTSAQYSAPVTAPAPATPPAPTYKIGDKGPAGGIVFYDKGNNSGGWRYLEAAPVTTERTAAITFSNWQAVEGNRKVGDGKENTNKFIVVFKREGGGINSAAWLCNELTVSGFNDWYLPSLDELLYMYNNLYLQGLADLKSANYWSSSVMYVYVYFLDFSDGSEKSINAAWSPPNERYQVRAIRRF